MEIAKNAMEKQPVIGARKRRKGAVQWWSGAVFVTYKKKNLRYLSMIPKPREKSRHLLGYSFHELVVGKTFNRNRD